MIKVLDKLISNRRYRNYHHAMDDLGLRFGVQFRVGPVFDSKFDKLCGWSPSLVFNTNTQVEATVVELGGHGNYYSNKNSAYEYIARQHLYKVMDSKDFMKNLDSLILD